MREDKNSEYNQLLQEAIIYFKKYPVFHKIFSGFCKKYESLGHLGGTVVIKSLTKDEKMQLSGFFQRDFYKNKTISISMQRMEKTLKDSKFESLEWMDILEEYFDHKIGKKPKARSRRTDFPSVGGTKRKGRCGRSESRWEVKTGGPAGCFRFSSGRRGAGRGAPFTAPERDRRAIRREASGRR